MAVSLLASACGQKAPKGGGEATLPELSRALQVWVMNNGAYPKDLTELTNFPGLFGKTLPTPPPGKKLAVDPRTKEVVFADQ